MNSESELATIFGGSIVLLIILSLIFIGFVVVYKIAQWKLFKKAGKNGWEALIPFYSTYVLIEIAGLNWWYFLIAISGTIVTILGVDKLDSICSIAAMAVNFFAFYNIAKRMKLSPIGYAVAAIFVEPIITMIFGFSNNYTYDKTIPVSPNGPIGQENTSSSSTSKIEKYCLGCGCKLNDGDEYCQNCGKKVEK